MSTNGSVVTVTPIRTFLLDHERLLIVIVLVIAGWFVSGKIEGAIAAHDSKNLQAITLKANADLAAANSAATTAAQSAATAQEQAAQYQALAQKTQAQDAAYQQQIVTLTAALTAQQKKDDTLSDPALAQRWESLLSLSPTAVTADPKGGLDVTDSASHQTVDALEQVPVLKNEITITNGQLRDADTLLAASNAQVSTLNTEVGNLNTEVSGLRLTITDDAVKCTDQIKVQHDKDVKAARKREKWIAIVSTILGVVARAAIK